MALSDVSTANNGKAYYTIPMGDFENVERKLRIDFDDFSESIPAYITIIAMPFCYSISEGISFGIISYVVINLLTGKREKISLLMYCLAVIFVMKYIFL